MKAFIGALIASIASAVVSVFAVTEMCNTTIAADRSQGTSRASTTKRLSAQPSQKLQQWLNY